MKKQRILLLMLCFALLSFTASAADIYTVTIEDIEYEVHAGEGYVVAKKYNTRNHEWNADIDIVIQNRVNGLPVTIIADNFTSGLNNTLVSASDIKQYKCVKSLILSENLREIGKMAFYGCSNMKLLSSDRLPVNVVNIGSYAFYQCASMTLNNLPPLLETIGYAAFSKCRINNSEAFPATLFSCGEDAFRASIFTSTVDMSSTGISILSKGMFSGAKMPGIVVPADLVSIEDECFFGAQVNSTIVLPDKVVSLGNSAFACLNAVGVDLSATKITSLPEKLFRNSTITKLDLPLGLESLSEWCLDGVDVEEIILHDRIKSLGNWALGGAGIQSIKIPSSVRSIGVGVFQNCTNLHTVDLSDCPLSVIPDAMFEECVSLEHLILSDAVSITKIGSSAFYRCVSLKSFTFPATITSIGSNAFYACMSLVEVDLSSCLQLQTIGDYAFQNSKIKSIALPDGVSTLGKQCFFNCSDLREVILNSNLTEIGYSAFVGCTNLERVISYANVPPVLLRDPSAEYNYQLSGNSSLVSRTFEFTTCQSAQLMVPKGSRDSYIMVRDKVDRGAWGEFRHIVEFDGTHLSGIDGVAADVDDADEPVMVYSTSGVQVWQGQRGNMPALSPGIYVVRGAASARKIVVR